MSEPKKILIADDEYVFLHSTADLLRRDGFDCDCADSAEEAVAALAAKSYDLLISDIKMPGNAEMEFVREIRDHNKSLPVIIVTGYPSVPTAVESLRLAVANYLVKPLDYQELLMAVRRAVDNGRSLRVIRSVREEMEGWAASLSRLEEQMRAAEVSEDVRKRDMPLDLFLKQSLLIIAQATVRLSSTFNALKPEAAEEPQNLCIQLGCPSLMELRGAMRESVEVLRRTKGAFKSKELGTLRQRLEVLLEAGG